METTGEARSRLNEDVDVESVMSLATRMADVADDLALAGFRTDHGVDVKQDGTPVTRIDREVEAALRDLIESQMPGAGILGEEYGETTGDDGRWVIDPIDGTAQFMTGDPRFSVLIAYEIEDEPVAGVVSAPALGLRWWAGAGLGARMSNGGQVSAARVSITRRRDRAVGMFLAGSGSDDSGSIAASLVGSGIRSVRRAVSWEAVRVASGEFDLAMTSGAIWDVAPLPIIVAEAGGVVLPLDSVGDRVSILFTNRRIAEAVRALI